MAAGLRRGLGEGFRHLLSVCAAAVPAVGDVREDDFDEELLKMAGLVCVGGVKIGGGDPNRARVQRRRRRVTATITTMVRVTVTDRSDGKACLAQQKG